MSVGSAFGAFGDGLLAGALLGQKLGGKSTLPDAAPSAPAAGSLPPIGEASAGATQSSAAPPVNAMPAGGGAAVQTRGGGRWTPTDESASAYRYFVKLGYSPAAAAGIVGNGVNESGMRLNAGLSHDGGTGFGVFGHRDPKPGQGRWTEMRKWAEARGLDINKRETQFDFVDHELKTSEKHVGDRLRSAKDAREAAIAMIDFERPGGWKPGNPTGANGYQNRIDAAMAHYNTLGQPAEPASAPQVATNAAEPSAVEAVVPQPSRRVLRQLSAQHQQEHEPATAGAFGFLRSLVDPEGSSEKPARPTRVVEHIAERNRPQQSATGGAFAFLRELTGGNAP